MIQFNEMGLRPEILQAIANLGFETPTPIQEKVIPFLLETRQDLVGLAQTGTGKTAAFGLPIIQQIDYSDRQTQALILSPTRELCIQISKDLVNYSKKMDNLNVVSVYGGADIKKQIDGLEKGAHVVVGTPGRTLDLIKRRKLKIGNIKWLVLDEADEMLSMGFKEELDAILENIKSDKQTLLFSATMPKEIVQIAENYMVNPFEISVGRKNTGAESVEHHFYIVHAKDRFQALKRIADINPNIYGIIFCRTRMGTKEVAEKLMQDGYNADALHGDLSQAQRDFVMDRFRRRHLQMLVATDVAARGLDVNNLSHVIHYDLPDDPEIYIHRSGRTGRAGKTGISISIIHLKEKGKLKLVEKKAGKSFEQKNVPTGREICEKQLFNLIDKVENIDVDEAQIDQFMPVIYKKLEWLDREELINHFVSVEFNRFLQYYKNTPDLNVVSEYQGKQKSRLKEGDWERSRERRKPKEFKSDKGTGLKERDFSDNRERSNRKNKNIPYSRFFINMGKNDHISKREILDLINRFVPVRNVEIGDIEVQRNFSFFEVDQKFQKDVLTGFKNVVFKGTQVTVDLARPK